MLYLLPNLLAEGIPHSSQLPGSVDEAVAQLTGLIAENEKQGRRFLRHFTYPLPKTFRDIPIFLLNEHSTDSDKKELLKKIQQGGVWGLVSDCGMPCLADPGADLVLMARLCGVQVETFAGPSSILFALVLSGLGGQHFTFHGYLPKEGVRLVEELRKIEKLSWKEGSTHLFIETPYRNVPLLDKMLSVLDGKTWLCIACDLSAPGQYVQTQRVQQWQKTSIPQIDRRPTVFALKGMNPTS